jgi:hypothetical protein
LWVASGGITEGQAGAEDDLRRFGGDAVVEPGGRGYGPNRETGAAHPHEVRHAGAMAGAFRKAVAILVRGPRGPVAIRVTREARDLSRCGSAVRIDGTDEGEGIDDIHLPRLTGRFCRVVSHRSREQGGRGWGWPS